MSWSPSTGMWATYSQLTVFGYRWYIYGFYHGGDTRTNRTVGYHSQAQAEAMYRRACKRAGVAPY